MNLSLKCYIFIFSLFGIAYCLKVIPQRAGVLYADPNELLGATFSVKRYGRKSGYYLNMDGNILHPWYNNVTIHLIFFEYLHNEYRRSFVEMHYKICDFLSGEKWTGAMFKNSGLTCPVYGQYTLRNLSVPLDTFHYKMPMERARIDVYFNMTVSNRMLYKGQIMVLLKN